MELCKELIEQGKQFGFQQKELQEFVQKINRIPSKEELAVCGALWSEHCSYKSSRVHLKRFHTQEPWVLQGPGENAGVVAITKNYGIAFKMESHNHPSYIEPYQGAATGVGGILRDVFCMGAMPIANLNCLRFGEGLWNAHLLKKTVCGIGDYGNSMGVPTVGGDTSFHVGYSKNILVNAFCAGLVHKDKIYKGILSLSSNSSRHISISENLLGKEINTEISLKETLYPKGENVLIYFGSATGRDGVHGATMSSSEFSQAGKKLKPTVQVGDPFAEKILLEATLALMEQNLTVGLQDMGAAGITSSSVEMAARSGCGVVLDLNKVPQRASNMQAWEILLSESQERMLCAVQPEKVEEVLNFLNKFPLSAAVIGQVNQTGLFVTLFDNKVTTATPISILVDEPPRYEWPLMEREEYLKKEKKITNTAKENVHHKNSLGLNGLNQDAHRAIASGVSLKEFLDQFPHTMEELFSHPNFADRSPITNHYCSTVQGNTVSGCGALQNSAAAIIRLPQEAQEEINKKRTQIGLALAAGCEERWVQLNPLEGTALSVLKIARKIVASNGTPLAMTDCLNFGNPRDPAVMRQFSDAVDGINTIAKEFHIPVVSGNVSLNNQTDGIPIPPTPMIGMVGKVHSVANITFNSTKSRKDVYFYQLSMKNSLQNSSYLASQSAWILGGENSHCPKLDLIGEKKLWNSLALIMNKYQPPLCFPVGHGGVLGSLFYCARLSKKTLSIAQEIFNEPMQNILSEGNQGFLFGIENQFSENEILSIFEKCDINSDEMEIKLTAAFTNSDENKQQKWVELSLVEKNTLKKFFD